MHITVDLVRDFQQELIFRLEIGNLVSVLQANIGHWGGTINQNTTKCREWKKSWPSNAADVQKKESQIILFATDETADKTLYYNHQFTHLEK